LAFLLSESQYSVNWAEEPLGLDIHQTLAQRFLHQTLVVYVQCNAWTYLAVIDGLGFIFLDPTGFFCAFFPSDPAVIAEGCAGSILILFARGVLRDRGVVTMWSP